MATSGPYNRVSNIEWRNRTFIILAWGLEAKRGAKRPVYKLTDYSGEEVKGSWYPEELEKITHNQYRIEKMLRRRTTLDGRKKKLVRWEGWLDKSNSSIDKSDEYDVAG